MSVVKHLVENVHEHIDIPAFFNDMLDEALEPALQKIVEDSSNTIDNIVKGALYPLLAAELKRIVKENWDKLPALVVDEHKDDGDVVAVSKDADASGKVDKPGDQPAGEKV